MTASRIIPPESFQAYWTSSLNCSCTSKYSKYIRWWYFLNKVEGKNLQMLPKSLSKRPKDWLNHKRNCCRFTATVRLKWLSPAWSFALNSICLVSSCRWTVQGSSQFLQKESQVNDVAQTANSHLLFPNLLVYLQQYGARQKRVNIHPILWVFGVADRWENGLNNSKRAESDRKTDFNSFDAAYTEHLFMVRLLPEGVLKQQHHDQAVLFL